MRLQPSCPFCRATHETEEERSENWRKRIEANDPVAMYQEGADHRKKGNYSRAFEYWTKAAELGDSEAHNCLSIMYRLGHGVEKDSRKEIYHMEEAAISGHPSARRNLGCEEMSNGNIDRAVKHWVIAATQGEDKAIKALMEAFKMGYLSKDDLAAALRAHKAAVEATKSPQREAAEKFIAETTRKGRGKRN